MEFIKADSGIEQKDGLNIPSFTKPEEKSCKKDKSSITDSIASAIRRLANGR